MSSSNQPTTDSIQQIPDHYLRCRTYGHSWDQIPNQLADARYQLLFDHYDTLRCVSCGAERFDMINRMGQVGQRSYKYPDRYALSFSLPRGEARLEYLQRTRAQESTPRLRAID